MAQKQKSLKSFFGNSEGGNKKRQSSDISKDTSWHDVEASQKAGIQQNPKRVFRSPDGIDDIDDSPVYKRSPAAPTATASRSTGSSSVIHSTIAMMIKKQTDAAAASTITGGSGEKADGNSKKEENANDTVNLSSKQSELN
jgi:hypothetical protein